MPAGNKDNNVSIEDMSKEDVVDNTEVDLSVSTKQNVTTCDTVYEVETYIGNSYLHSIESIPFSFTGLNREELQKEIEQ